ncbi:MAG: four helix bundle protein [Candidatus Andersenbacteria bacterium]
MSDQGHNAIWEHRQAELWDRIFQVTQDVVTLADVLDDSVGANVMRQEMVKSAMGVGKYLVRGTAADNEKDFEKYVVEARMKAIETDYWLRLAYIVQQREDVQRDLSSIITQYSGIIDLLYKMARHVNRKHDFSQHARGPKVNL